MNLKVLCQFTSGVRDDASLPGKQEYRNKKQMAKESIADHGPPSAPLQKESSDTLVSLACRSKTRSPSQTEQLKKIFDEVAPGFTARNKSKSLFVSQL
jgi:hypothetical protein